MTENLDFSLVGTWTMENAGAIAYNFDCYDSDKFRQLLVDFIDKFVPEDADPDRVDDLLGYVFIRILASNELRNN